MRLQKFHPGIGVLLISEIPARTDGPTAKDIVKRAVEISTLPDMVARVLAVTNDPNSGANDLAHAIELDPALTIKLLRVVNSAGSGVRNKVNNLGQAIGLIGFQQAKNIVVAASVCDIFKDNTNIGAYSRHGLWTHLVAVAATARMISSRQKVGDPDEAFLAGLLHDFGIIIEDQFDHEAFQAMMENYPTGQQLVEVEKHFLGYDHTKVGNEIADHWGLPGFVRAAVRLHHAPKYSGPYAKPIACVELANVMVTLQGTTSVGAPLLSISPTVLDHLSLSRKDIEELVGIMNLEVEKHQVLVDLVTQAQ